MVTGLEGGEEKYAGGREMWRGSIHRTSFLGLSIVVYSYQVATISVADTQC